MVRKIKTKITKDHEMATEITHTVGIAGAPSRDYSLLSSWDAAQTRNLVSVDEIAIAECYNDGEMTDALNLSASWVTGSSNYIKIYTPDGERHSDTIDTGFHIKHNTSVPIATSKASNVVIDGIEIEAQGIVDTCILGGFGEDGTITISDCLFQCAAGSGEIIDLGPATGYTVDVIIDECRFNWLNFASGGYDVCYVHGSGMRDVTFSNNILSTLTSTDWNEVFYTAGIDGDVTSADNTVSLSGDCNYAFNIASVNFSASGDSVSLVGAAVGVNIAYRIDCSGDVTVDDASLTVSGNWGYALVVVDGVNATISGSTVTVTSDGVAAVSTDVSGNVDVHGCTITITGTTPSGLKVDSKPSVNVSIYQNEISIVGSNGYGIFADSFTGNANIYRNKIHLNTSYSGGDGIYTNGGVIINVYNNMVMNFNRAAYFDGAPTSIRVYYNSAYNNVYGFFSNSVDIIYKNNAVLCQESVGDYYDYDNVDAHADSEYNASRASSLSSYKAPGSNSIYSILPADNFTDTTPNSEDLHIKDTDADIYDVGKDLSSDLYLVVTDDYDGDSRSTDMGADEYVEEILEAILNVYKTNYYLDAYSKDGNLSDPIFKYPTSDFAGTSGESKDIQLFLRNDGDYITRNLVITPTDLSDSDESTWMKLATTQGGLDSAVAGAALSYESDLNPNGTFVFWLRTTIPASTDAQRKVDLALRLTYDSFTF